MSTCIPRFHVHIDPTFQGIIFSNIQVQVGSKVTTKAQREEPDEDGVAKTEEAKG
jgi:hypothetical protein